VPGVVSQHGASILFGGAVFDSRGEVPAADADAFASILNSTGFQHNIESLHFLVDHNFRLCESINAESHHPEAREVIAITATSSIRCEKKT